MFASGCKESILNSLPIFYLQKLMLPFNQSSPRTKVGWKLALDVPLRNTNYLSLLHTNKTKNQHNYKMWLGLSHAQDSEAVRVEVALPCIVKGLMKDLVNGGSTAPVFPFKSCNSKMVGFVQDDIRSGEEGIVMAPKFHFPQVLHPVGHNLAYLLSHGEEIRDERLAELGLDLSRILKDASHDHIHMLQLH
jgi:hypothetical protein